MPEVCTKWPGLLGDLTADNLGNGEILNWTFANLG